ncbi:MULTISPECIES: hypothetical protein [Chryseobacterium]|uniref:Uncharacterized protein n=1 Tax=Chryseobacterium taihuense TaxID=1141221 RepID=A0A1G9MDI7_9FLAO|nr:MULTISPECIES: hypothetical protein [Chryseobacterium]QQV03687.1 hypothetical protein I6I61_04940 [Chryseobacterium sp. FDAARGOS 1104]SDL72173.1 hypothetical protein SAMN05216273_10575 [Chryseobacterium taihuense]VFB02973.1 Uncharacterised protein [Chryseobacterium taihuense]
MSSRFLSVTALLLLSKGLMAQNHNTDNMMRTLQHQNRMIMMNEEQRRFNRFMTSQPMMSSEKLLIFYKKYLDDLNEKSAKVQSELSELKMQYEKSNEKKILKQIQKKEQKLESLYKSKKLAEDEIEKLEAKKLPETNK